MSKLSRIEQLRQTLQAEKERKDSGGKNFSNNRDIYPFWTMAIGDTARIRILPDKNEDNVHMFYVEKLDHTITINGADKKIPCRKMYGQPCPICDLSKQYYDAEGKESKNGKYYYRKKVSLARIVVLDDPLPVADGQESYEGKVCNTQLSYQIMETIKQEISDPDLGDFTDLEEGSDFIIKKTKQGDYGTYSVGSGFARRPTAIPEDIRSTIELIDLETLLPKDLGLEKVTNMLNAHITGEDYVDEDAPEGKTPAKTETKTESKPAPKAPVKEAVKEEVKVETRRKPVEEVAEADEDDGDDSVTTNSSSDSDEAEEDDIFAALKRRKEARAAAKK